MGLIKFGSRVDVLIPAEAELQVKVGQRVRGGSSVLAVMMAGAGAAGRPQQLRSAADHAEPDDEQGDLR